ncbi:MAG: response regulator [Nitrososphaeraceae archaeon]
MLSNAYNNRHTYISQLTLVSVNGYNRGPLRYASDMSGSDDNQSVFDVASEEICFLAHSQNYCVCIVDMVDSTKITAEISDHLKIRQYYSIFINAMAILAKNHGAKIVKNAGDALIFYFPETSDSGNEPGFKTMLECLTTMILSYDIMNAKMSSENLPSVSYRISADYGKVEIATSTSSKTEDLFGSTMNICAKINAMAEPNGIVIGGDLYRIVTSFHFSNEYKFKGVRGYSVGFKSLYPVYAIEAKNRDRLERGTTNLFTSKIPTLGIAHDREPQQKQSVNIMVVDDEPDILITFKSFLSSEGYNVNTFTDPQDALSNIAQLPNASSHYQLVLLDIRMPGLNGLQLFYKIRTLSPNTKIMFISALDITEELVSILPGVSADDFVKKPVGREYFVTKVRAACSRS